jgi:predicted dehydrogenase
MAAIEAARSKLDQPLALGYCNVGTVIEAAQDTPFHAGDRVVSNGGHAGVVSVPKNLCAVVPDNVDNECASFTVLGAISLQGIRLSQPSIGETVVVTGLGIIGLLTVQMLRAQGCRVMAVDVDPRRLEIARTLGAYAPECSSAEETPARAMQFSRNRGVDAVIITASTPSSEPVSQAAKICRKRGRIVLVGVTGLNLSRQDFYEKELTFQVSCSYGPGRYDPEYEQKGHDYPLGFVRWTEQRNFEAVLDLMASGALNVKPLITHRYPIDQAKEAYAVLTDKTPSLGIVLQYPDTASSDVTEGRTVTLDSESARNDTSSVVGCIGAGNYGGRILLPALAATGARLHTVVTASGLNGVHYGRKFGFMKTSTSTDELFDTPDINTVVITTRHDTHAALTAQALRTGRHVYVEKPLALTMAQLLEVESSYADAIARGTPPILMVGFNRRFSLHIKRIKQALERVEGPKSLNMLMNAGSIEASHWTQDTNIGGGRILGEACHFIDLARFLIGEPIVNVNAVNMRTAGKTQDTAQISLEFADGSIASIQYYANGHRSFPKERIEVFASGGVLQLDNFRNLRSFGWPGLQRLRTWKQDKGHKACLKAFVDATKSGGPSPIPADELFEVSRVTIQLAERLRSS